MFTVHCQGVRFEAISAILWDKDGTLADSHSFLRTLAERRSRLLDQHVPGVYAQLMAAFGCGEVQYDPAGLMAVGTRYDNEVAAATLVAMTGRPWADALALAQDVFVESDRSLSHKAPLTPPLPDIPPLLTALQQMGLKQAILSGDTTQNIQDFVAHYQLEAAIAWCAGSKVPPGKPDPQMVRTACVKLGVQPDQCLVVGDSGLDLQLARNAGCGGFVSVTWGGSPAIVGADAVLTHPQQWQCEPSPT
ncbi:MAG: HAD family hydrolase [Leptolyngbyaceae cyanobacterium]